MILQYPHSAKYKRDYRDYTNSGNRSKALLFEHPVTKSHKPYRKQVRHHAVQQSLQIKGIAYRLTVDHLGPGKFEG
jgi:hypothetical protein